MKEIDRKLKEMQSLLSKAEKAHKISYSEDSDEETMDAAYKEY